MNKDNEKQMTSAKSQATKEKAVTVHECTDHIHFCEIVNMLKKVTIMAEKQSCTKINIGKEGTTEIRISEFTIVKVNASGIYINITRK